MGGISCCKWFVRKTNSPFFPLFHTASIGAVGGIRGLWQSRIPLEGPGVFVYPDMFTLAHSHQAFDVES